MIEVLEGEWLAGEMARQQLTADPGDGDGGAAAVDEETQMRANALVSSMLG